jgi:translation initiation factor 2 alpha subunit (eIF-2alpha)
LVAPPLFVIITSSLHKEHAFKAVENAIEAIRKEITSRQGDVTVKVAVSQDRLM